MTKYIVSWSVEIEAETHLKKAPRFTQPNPRQVVEIVASQGSSLERSQPQRTGATTTSVG